MKNEIIVDSIYIESWDSTIISVTIENNNDILIQHTERWWGKYDDKELKDIANKIISNAKEKL